MNSPMIYEKIIAVMNSLKAITKSKQGNGFKFRGIDDLYNELHPLFAEHGIFSVPTVLDEVRFERTAKSGSALNCAVLRIKYTFYALDGSSIESIVSGEAMDSGDKATNKCMSVAHKYALLQIFTIPTVDLIDPDTETFNVEPKQPFVAELKGLVSGQQVMNLVALSKTKNLTPETMKDLIKRFGSVDKAAQLSVDDYSRLYKMIQEMNT